MYTFKKAKCVLTVTFANFFLLLMRGSDLVTITNKYVDLKIIVMLVLVEP